MGALLKDLRYAARMLRKNPGFTAIAILTLALGIGANAAVFTLTYAVILKRLPVPNPQQLVRYTFRNDNQDIGLSGPLYDALNAHESAVTGVLAWSGAQFAIRENGLVRSTPGAMMTANGFSVLDLHPALGRAFSGKDDVAGGGPEGFQALVGYDYWQRRFHGESAALGQSLTVNGRVVTVIGVLPKGFDGLVAGSRTDLLLPLSFEEVVNAPQPARHRAGSFWLTVMGRLKPGQSLRSAAANLQATEGSLREEADPKHIFLTGFFAPFKIGVESGSSGRSFLRTSYERPLLVLEIMVGLLLLLCSANIALLMLARVSNRYQEFVVRVALGAPRWRLFRSVLSEALLLAACGLGAGLMLGWWAAQSLVAQLTLFGNAPAIDVTPRAMILAFTGGSAVFSALAASLWPALRASRTAPQPALRQTQPTSALKPLGGWFVPAQVAVSIVLLTAASLLSRTLINLVLEDSGFRAAGVVMADVDLSAAKPTATQAAQDSRRILDRVETSPGVESAALMSMPPLHDWWSSAHYFSVDSRGAVHHDLQTWPETVSPNYFATMGTEIKEGRAFVRRDLGGPGVCLLSASAARYFFPDEDAVGKLMYAGGEDPSLDSPATVKPEDTCSVIGVAGDAHFRSLREAPPRMVYRLLGSGEPGAEFSIAVRGRSSADAAAAIRSAVRFAAPTAFEPPTYTFSELVAQHLRRERMLTALSASFAGVALLLTALGLYGLLSRSVALRTREIGIRLALGARPGDTRTMVIRQGMKLVLIGAVLGGALSLAAARVLRGALFGIGSSDPLNSIGVVALLLLVAFVACYLPARRATKVDPMEALRYE